MLINRSLREATIYIWSCSNFIRSKFFFNEYTPNLRIVDKMIQFFPNLQPSAILRMYEFGLFLATVFLFLVTNYYPALYDPWHCFMHIVPSIWAIIVANYHKPLLFQIYYILLLYTIYQLIDYRYAFFHFSSHIYYILL